MQLEIYQWLVPLISIFYIIRTVRQYSKGKYSPRNTIIWIGFWTSIALLAIMPDTIPNSIAKALGFKDHINATIFVALGILFLMVFYLSAALNRVENRLTELVRQLALHEKTITLPQNSYLSASVNKEEVARPDKKEENSAIENSTKSQI